jgi:hypothetical protein
MEEFYFISKSHEISSTKFRDKISFNYPLKVHKPYFMDGWNLENLQCLK